MDLSKHSFFVHACNLHSNGSEPKQAYTYSNTHTEQMWQKCSQLLNPGEGYMGVYLIILSTFLYV